MKYIISILFIFIFHVSANNSYHKSHVTKKQEQKKEIYTGIDISKYQKINWKEIENIDFIICKKSEGITLEDKNFRENINKIKCLKGIYHFFRPQYSGIEQAKFFLKDIDTLQINIKPVIDVEWSKWWSNNNKDIGISRLKEMISSIENELGCKPIIYTSPTFWNKFIGDKIDLRGINLWVADWRGDTLPEIPNGFKNWHIWQQSSTKKINGIEGPVDWNISKSIDSLIISKLIKQDKI